jgi:NADH-quinone oxidoreductase subunit G
MPRPKQRMVTFSIDGLEVTAPENVMLVDGAKYGDVEIPVFCYEPKLGAPVGACRMCLVEIEGIPKLQTACSTPVKDGMVVHTQTERVRHAQEAVVEFLLINHPLDCPVCDKGGECPLQDISFGWGGGRSRFIEPKRHFVKPLALSPLIAIDRERCILCYRCVRFSQEISEDYQLILQERGAHSYVATFDGHPYVAPFSGNIMELCPVGALTSQPYRFRARPWDIEMAGSVCTLCPSQCNVSFTVRDERVLRVNARDNAEVDDGWLCDKGRFAYQAVHVEERVTEPMVRDGGELRPVSWERALSEAASGLKRAGGRVGAIVGGETTNEEGFLLQRIVRDGLGSNDIDSRAAGGPSLDLQRALGAPALQATVPDLEFAHAVLVLDCEPVDDAPILDLRIRKGVRRRGVALAIASSRPSSLDANAKTRTRFAPGAGEALLGALDAALGVATGEARRDEVGRLAEAAGTDADGVHALADLLAGAGEDVVILYGERLLAGPRADHAARALLNVAGRLKLAGAREGAGLLCVPAGTNGRGLAEVGVLPHAGPGFAEPALEGRNAAQIAGGAAAGELGALYLMHTDPLRDLPHRELWTAALDAATTVVAHADFLTEGIREHATVVFPSESYAEKEGTVTHPDGRLQRLRPSIAHQGETQAEWAILVEIARRIGLDLDVPTGPLATALVAASVPFYGGITHDEIGGKGVRWQDREQAAAYAFEVDLGPFELEPAPASPGGADGRFLLGTFRSVWAAPEVEVSPALKFLHPRQRVEISPADAQRLNVLEGDRVVVGSNGTIVRATVALRDAMPPGSVFLQDAIPEDSASALEGPLVEVRKA